MFSLHFWIAQLEYQSRKWGKFLKNCWKPGSRTWHAKMWAALGCCQSMLHFSFQFSEAPDHRPPPLPPPFPSRMESAGAKPEKRVLIGKLQKPKGVENIPYCICSRCHSKALIMPSANRRRQRSRHILLTAPYPPTHQTPTNFPRGGVKVFRMATEVTSEFFHWKCSTLAII